MAKKLIHLWKSPSFAPEIWEVEDSDITALVSSGVGNHGCFATRTSTQTIAVDSDVAISFTGTDVFDTDAYHDPSSNASRITIPTGRAGTYIISGSAGGDVPSITMTQVRLNIRINNSTTLGCAEYAFPATDNKVNGRKVFLSVSTIYQLAEGDYVELFFRHEDSAANFVTGTPPNPFLSVQQLA